MNEARKRLRELAERARDEPPKWSDSTGLRYFLHMYPFQHACTPETILSLLDRVERLEAFVSETSRQHLPDEMESPEHADFEGAYIIMVNKARSLLTEDQSS